MMNNVGGEAEADEVQRFALAFEYYFRHFYAQTFPREPLMHNLLDSIRPFFRKIKVLRDAKQHSHKREISLWETSQAITTANNHVITPARRHLAKLLNGPAVQNLFLAYDEIANYSEDLLPNDANHDPMDNPTDVPIKIVNIVKGNEPLGATIKAFANGEIYVARVIAGGSADRCGSIHPGDQILEVNGVPVSFKSPHEVIRILGNSTDGVVSFKLVPSKIDTQPNHVEPPVRIKPIKRHVRAHFDYLGNEDELQPCPEAALSFQNGDILEIYNGEDIYWEQARCIGHGSLVTGPLSQIMDDDITTVVTEASTSQTELDSQRLSVGIIPTELVLRRQNGANGSTSAQTDIFYEPVSIMEPGEIRPIVLIGATGVGRKELKKRLILHNPTKYAAPIPHTSRPQRPNEKNGVDYIFTTKSQMEAGITAGQFVECGELNGNLYGTMDSSVFQLMRQGKTPVFDAHPLSLRVLRSPLFKPIVVFVEPPNFSLMKKTRMSCGARSSLSPTGRTFTDNDFAQIISYSAQLSALYGRYTDFRVVNGILDEAVSELTHILRDYELLPSWVPENWLEAGAAFKNSVC